MKKSALAPFALALSPDRRRHRQPIVNALQPMVFDGRCIFSVDKAVSPKALRKAAAERAITSGRARSPSDLSRADEPYRRSRDEQLQGL